VSEGNKKRKIERDGETVPALSAMPVLSFARSGWPPSNPAALHQIRLVSSSPLSLLPRREREGGLHGRRLHYIYIYRERER